MKNKKINILVVEDNKDHLYFIKKALVPEKYNLKIITDGEEAYNYLSQPHILLDVVLLDQYLPNMNGFEILEDLKIHNKQYSIIFMSVDNASETIDKAFRLGAQKFVAKGATLGEDLLKNIKALTQLSKHDSF